MNCPLNLRVEESEARRVNLEDGKTYRDCRNDFCHDARIFHGIGFGVVLFQNFFRSHLFSFSQAAHLLKFSRRNFLQRIKFFLQSANGGRL